MYEFELKTLFTQEEFAKFEEYMNSKIWYNVNVMRYAAAGDIQSFILNMEANTRKEDILYACISTYPQIVGLKAEEK